MSNPDPDNENGFVLFETTEEAWFWFLKTRAARSEGARMTQGLAKVQRPCEPLDIMRILDRLYRHRRLVMDHLLVLRHYGARGMAPDRRRMKEARAATIWAEAMERLDVVFKSKGIVKSGGAGT